MTKNKMFLCNLLLLIFSVITIISSIILELIDFSIPMAWIHTIVSITWSIFVFYHIILHWGGIQNWLREIRKLKLKMTKAITWLFFIVFLSGILAIIMVCIQSQHTMAGGIHGKFGLILTILMIIHVVKRRKWYNGRTTGKHFIPHIDNDKCTKCKQCIKHCPANVLNINNENIIASSPEYCFACKKCIATCSKNAISCNTFQVAQNN